MLPSRTICTRYNVGTAGATSFFMFRIPKHITTLQASHPACNSQSARCLIADSVACGNCMQLPCQCSMCCHAGDQRQSHCEACGSPCSILARWKALWLSSARLQTELCVPWTLPPSLGTTSMSRSPSATWLCKSLHLPHLGMAQLTQHAEQMCHQADVLKSILAGCCLAVDLAAICCCSQEYSSHEITPTMIALHWVTTHNLGSTHQSA